VVRLLLDGHQNRLWQSTALTVHFVHASVVNCKTFSLGHIPPLLVLRTTFQAQCIYLGYSLMQPVLY